MTEKGRKIPEFPSMGRRRIKAKILCMFRSLLSLIMIIRKMAAISKSTTN